MNDQPAWQRLKLHVTQNICIIAQGLKLHKEWQGKSVDILKLYDILHMGDLDAMLPVLTSLHVQQPISIRQLTSLSRQEMAAVAAPSMASLHYSAAFSKNPNRQTGRNFAEMAVDVTCMGIVLNETMPAAFLQCFSYHLMDHTMSSQNPSLWEIVVRPSYLQVPPVPYVTSRFPHFPLIPIVPFLVVEPAPLQDHFLVLWDTMMMMMMMMRFKVCSGPDADSSD